MFNFVCIWIEDQVSDKMIQYLPALISMYTRVYIVLYVYKQAQISGCTLISSNNLQLLYYDMHDIVIRRGLHGTRAHVCLNLILNCWEQMFSDYLIVDVLGK